ncbi:ATP-dependent RNA helicase MAK5, partial [Striga asiatica]
SGTTPAATDVPSTAAHGGRASSSAAGPAAVAIARRREPLPPPIHLAATTLHHIKTRRNPTAAKIAATAVILHHRHRLLLLLVTLHRKRKRHFQIHPPVLKTTNPRFRRRRRPPVQIRPSTIPNRAVSGLRHVPHHLHELPLPPGDGLRAGVRRGRAAMAAEEGVGRAFMGARAAGFPRRRRIIAGIVGSHGRKNWVVLPIGMLRSVLEGFEGEFGAHVD